MKKINLMFLIVAIILSISALMGCSSLNIKYISEEENYFLYNFTADKDYDSFGFYVTIKRIPEQEINAAGFDSFVTDKVSDFPKLKKGEVVGLKITKKFVTTTESGKEEIIIEKSDIQKIKIVGIKNGKEIFYEQNLK